MNGDEITQALQPLVDTGRVSIVGLALYNVMLSVDGAENGTVYNIPFDATAETLLSLLTEAYAELAAILSTGH